MFRAQAAAAMMVAGLGLLSAAGAATYSVVSETSTAVPLPVGELRFTDTVVQEGATPLNRFQMHRVWRPGIPYRGSVLLLPPLGNGFKNYLFDEGGDVTQSFAAHLAKLGFEAWGYTGREARLSAGQCSGATDCSPALQWSLQTVVDDAAYIRRRIRQLHPGKDPVIGGLSLGAVAALAAVNQRPNDYAGLLAWEGSLITSDPVVRAHNLNFCNQFDAMVAAGVAVDDQSLPFVKLVSQLSATAPNDPFLIPVAGFPPGLTNRQALVFILSTPNPFAPSARPGFIAAAGDVASGQFFFSNPARLSANIAVFNDATATRTQRDLYCSLAGTETAYSDNLGQFKKPVMIIKAGQGFGSILDELPAKLGSTAVTFTQINNFGHVDHYGTPIHLFLLEAPIANWLNGVF